MFWYFKQWRQDGVADRPHDALRDRVRDAEGGAITLSALALR